MEKILIILSYIVLTIFFIILLIIQKRKFSKKKSPDGFFVINTTNPNKEVIRIEYSTNPADFMTKDRLIFDVIIEDEIRKDNKQ